MIPLSLLSAAWVLLPGETSPNSGIIGGIVVNASRNLRPAAGAEVILRIKIDRQVVAVEETTADKAGRFRFENLFVGQGYHYLCGANWEDIHYPGPAIRLCWERRQIDVQLAVRDSVADPSPLEIRDYDVVVQPEGGAVKVTESMLVANPSPKTYVGRATPEETTPVTLRLSIPKDFIRTTFHKEFFGRRFSVVNGKLVTDLPWTPGERELKFTYWVPNGQGHHDWERPLDLPCSHVRVRVWTPKPNEVACNLQPGPARRRQEMTELTFECKGRTLPAGYVIRLDLEQLPLPWMAYGRRLAPLALIGLVAGAGLAIVKRRCRRRRRTP